MSDWQEITLGEISSIEIGGTPSRSEERYWWKSDNDGIRLPWVSISDMKGRVITDTKESITEIGALQSNCKHVPKGTLLMSFKLTIGRLAFAGRDLYTNEAISAIRPTKDVHPEFLYYGLQHWNLTGDSDQAVKGATLNKQKLQEIPCLLPPLPEQKKIAEILSGIDHATDSISRRIAKEEALFISLQHELLSDIAGAAFALPRHQDQALKILPVARLFEVQLGKMLNKEAKEHGHQFQYVGNKNVQQWNPDLRQLESMHFSDDERRKFALKPFDLLVCEGGDAGRCCIWERGETEIYYQKAIHRMRPINDDCLPTFMMHYLSYCKTNNLLSDFISRTSISHLTREKLLEVPVALPSHQEQSSIVNKLELQRKSISKLFSKSKIMKDLKSAVAFDLLSGRKRVSV